MSEARSWNRPMLVFAWACVALAVASVVGLLVDDRTLGGAPVWVKPLKFAISGAVYGVTWSWLTSLITRRERTVRRSSAVVVALLGLELAIIVTQAVRGRYSHFNFATVPDAILYEIMATSIAIVWCGNLVLTLLVLRSDIQDRARKLTVGLGAVISLVGIGVGVLMTFPSGAQIAAMNAGHGIALGAHTFGGPDGGPGLPLLGWSTTAGDLRIPHFVGMHALQAMLLWHVLVGRLRRPVQAQLAWIGASGFAGLLVLLTWQAYRGQPLTKPDAWTLGAAGLLLASLVTAAVVVWRQNRPTATVTWIGEVKTRKAA